VTLAPVQVYQFGAVGLDLLLFFPSKEVIGVLPTNPILHMATRLSVVFELIDLERGSIVSTEHRI
jgi:hypothetical protein